MFSRFIFYIFSIFLFQLNSGITQTSGWDQLSDVTIKKEFNDYLGFEVEVPEFSDSIKKLQGSTIQLDGYIIPIEGYKSHTEFIFSAYPYNMCYFCGGAGPETVMEVEAQKPIEFTSEKISIQGILYLNSKDPNRLMFILEKAELL